MQKKSKKTFEALIADRIRRIQSIKNKLNPDTQKMQIGSGRGKKCWYESKMAGNIFLDSTWELAYVQQYLDPNNIPFRKNVKKFPYVWNYKLHFYIPDFELIETGEFVEVKGVRTDRDDAKWQSFPGKLIILMGQDLESLGCKIKW